MISVKYAIVINPEQKNNLFPFNVYTAKEMGMFKLKSIKL